MNRQLQPKKINTLLTAFILYLILSPALAANYSYSIINTPANSPVNNTPKSINKSNTIVGADIIFNTTTYQSTTVIKPNAQRIELKTINNQGQVVGVAFTNNDNDRQSFVYDSNGFSTIYYPGSIWTIATDINDQGIVSGWVSMPEYRNSAGNYIGGNFSFIATPNASLKTNSISPAITFDTPLNIEFSAPEISSTLTADFNNDGSDDLVIAHTDAQKVQIYFGQSDSIKIFDESREIGKRGWFSIGIVSSFAKADFDEDGLIDLVIGSRQCDGDNRQFMVARSLGTGSFTTGACLAITPNLGRHDSYVYSIAVADFNEDKHMDIVVSRTGNYGAKQVILYFGNGDMTFSTANIIYDSNTFSKRPYKLLAADVTNDGHIDLLIEQAKFTSQKSTMLFQGDGNGKFLIKPSYKIPWPKNYKDFNNDGHPDKIASINSTTLLYFGTETGTFNSTPQIFNIPSTDIYNELRKITADFNGDGQIDLLITNRNWSENVLGKMYFQTSNPTVPTPKPNPPITPNKGEQIDITGQISAIGNNVIIVNSINIFYTTSTLLFFEDGTSNAFSIGQRVAIQGFKNNDGSITAVEIGISP